MSEQLQATLTLKFVFEICISAAPNIKVRCSSTVIRRKSAGDLFRRPPPDTANQTQTTGPLADRNATTYDPNNSQQSSKIQIRKPVALILGDKNLTADPGIGTANHFQILPITRERPVNEY
jgi:hypothetical protein